MQNVMGQFFFKFLAFEYITQRKLNPNDMTITPNVTRVRFKRDGRPIPQEQF